MPHRCTRRYLAAADVGDASALLTMPTGTGKTGVIATIAMAIPEVPGHRLVLTPWTRSACFLNEAGPLLANGYGFRLFALDAPGFGRKA